MQSQSHHVVPIELATVRHEWMPPSPSPSLRKVERFTSSLHRIGALGGTPWRRLTPPPPRFGAYGLGLKLQTKPQCYQATNNITRPPLLQMGLDARRGDILDTGRVDRYCTRRRSIAHRAQVSAVHKPCKVARVPPQPPWHQASPITTGLLWPVVLSTQPGQPGWAPRMGPSIDAVGIARSSTHPTVR